MFRKLLDEGQAGDNIGVPAPRHREGRHRARPDPGEAGHGHAAQEVRGRGLRPEEGRGRPSHAVLHELPPAVLHAHDGRDRHRAAARRHEDGHAGRQHHDDDRAHHAGRARRADALRHPRRRHAPSAPASSPRSSSNEEADHGCDHQDPHSPQGVRSPAARQVGQRHRRDGEAHRRARGGPDPAADAHRALHGAPRTARRQEVARAVRDPHAQAPARHPRADAADARRADEARSVGRRRRRDQVAELERATRWQPSTSST